VFLMVMIAPAMIATEIVIVGRHDIAVRYVHGTTAGKRRSICASFVMGRWIFEEDKF
jgi:hypothetical protein